jgi:hypothetical protein
MNTGIGDAVNLAWKLSDVISGRASPKILESYNDERIAFAKVLINSTDQAFKVIASRGLIGSVVRAYVIPFVFANLTRFKTTLRIMFRTVSQIRIQYQKSFMSLGHVGSICAGDRLPWVKTETGDNYESLHTVDWQIHVYGDAASQLKEASSQRDKFFPPLYEIKWQDDFAKCGLTKGAMYLVRPDGYIAMAESRQDAAAVKKYFKERGYNDQ